MFVVADDVIGVARIEFRQLLKALDDVPEDRSEILCECKQANDIDVSFPFEVEPTAREARYRVVAESGNVTDLTAT